MKVVGGTNCVACGALEGNHHDNECPVAIAEHWRAHSEAPPPFNRLSPAEAERLALLSEELGEAQQAIGKILRHGYESYHPYGYKPGSNREQLEQELGDVLHAVDRLCAVGDLKRTAIVTASVSKAERVGAYLHHQEQVDVLDANQPD